MNDQPVTQSQLKEDLHALELRLLERLDQRLGTQRIELLERLEKSETNLLKAFRQWAVPVQSRFKVQDALLTGIDQRVTLLEERMDSLERDLE